MQNFINILSVGANLFHADRRTDGHMTKLIVAFHNFANVPKIVGKRLFTFKRELFLLYLHSSANFAFSFSYTYALPLFLHISLEPFPFVHLVVFPVSILANSVYLQQRCK